MRAYLLSLAVLLTAFSHDSLAQWRDDSLTGTWKVTLKSRNRTWTETIQLRQESDKLEGTMTVSDGSRGSLVGLIDGRLIRLERDTGLSTTQKFELRRAGDRLTGRYWNEGQIPDDGTVEFERIDHNDPFLAGNRGGNIGGQNRDGIWGRDSDNEDNDLAGAWQITIRGQSSTTRETVRLQQQNDRVWGTMTTPDDSNRELRGTYDGRTLTLVRDTGRDTTQRFQFVRQGSGFRGRFQNTGRWADEGEAWLDRTSDVGPGRGDRWEDQDNEDQYSLVTGTWRISLRGQSGAWDETLQLRQQGNRVTGTMTTRDHTKGDVEGRYDGQTLTLSRETGRQTTQNFELVRRGSRFQGRFWNQGRWPDEGTAELRFTSGQRWGNDDYDFTSVTGSWRIRLEGQNATWNETLQLRQQGDRVTGTMTTSDGTRGRVQGTFDGTTLQLERDTGRDTVQRFQLRPRGSSFRGHFWNQGKYEDQGAVIMRRQ